MSVDRHTLVRDKARWFGAIRGMVAHSLTRGYVISYPKSGRTWLRMLLATYFSERYGVTRTPEITDQWRQNVHTPLIRFVHLGTGDTDHAERSFDPDLYRHKRNVHLVRDPRDVCVSYYFHVTRRWKEFPEAVAELGAFLRHESFGLPRVVAFMNLVARWGESWPRVMSVSYEEMHEGAEDVLARVLEFMGERNAPEGAIARAVESCVFEKMQELERRGGIEHDALLPGDALDPQSYKMREGRIGSYSKWLDDADLEYMESYISAHLDERFERYRWGNPESDPAAVEPSG